jgi:hypothetical protein
VRGAVQLCLYSEQALLSRIGQSASGGLPYQGPPSKLRSVGRSVGRSVRPWDDEKPFQRGSVVQQLLITHRIKYTPCHSTVLSRYSSIVYHYETQHFLNSRNVGSVIAVLNLDAERNCKFGFWVTFYCNPKHLQR